MAIQLTAETKKQISETVLLFKEGNAQERDFAYGYLQGILAVADKNDDDLAGYVKAVLEDDDDSGEWDGAWPNPSTDPPITELPMVRVSRHEYAQLAQALGTPPVAKYLVMSNGVRVGWRSNRFTYVSPVAFKVATGAYPEGYQA